MLREKASARQPRTSAAGFTLIETLLAIALLAVGVMGLATLIPFATRNDYRSRIDTTATFLAMRELEQIMAQPFTATSFTAAADGADNPATVNISCTPVPCSDGADVDGDGNIDFSQAPADVPDGFRRDYTIAASDDATTPKVNWGTYDIRWRIEINANGVKSIVIAARPEQDLPGIIPLPANLRAVKLK